MEVLKYIRTFFWVLLFLFSSEGITQINDADSAYESLDSFLETPSPEKASAFKNELNYWKASSDYEQLAKVVSFCNLGNYERQILNFQEAIKSYEIAKNLYKQYSLSGYDMLNSCYIPLGNLYTKTNALSEAENQIKEYILLAQRTNRATETVAGLLNLSVVFQNQGNHLQAIRVLEEGIKMAPKDYRLKLNLATNLFLIGELDASEIIVNQVLKRDPASVKAHQLKAEMQLKKDEPEAAMQSLIMASQLLRKNKDGTLRDLAKICLALAKTEKNLDVVNPETNYLHKIYSIFLQGFETDQVLPKSEQLIAENTLIDALDLHASIYTKQGNLAMAFKAYQLAFEVSDKLDENTLLQDSKIMRSGALKIRSEQSLQLLYELYSVEKDSLWLHEAIQVDHRSKSPILLKERSLRKKLLKSGDTVLVNKIHSTRRILSLLGNQLKDIENAPSLNAEQLENVQQKYNESTVLLRDLQAQLGLPNIYQDEDISVERLKAVSLAKNETAVSYFIGKKSIFQFVISEGKVDFVKLADSKEKCDQLLDSYSKVISFFDTPSEILNDPASYVKYANNLYNLLAIPKVNKLVVIPDGMLSFLPLDALLTDTTNALSFSEMPFLIKATELSYALSLNDFLRVSEPKEFDGSVLGVFPVFEGTTRELTYSISEADALEKIVNANVLMHENATVNTFLQEADSFDVIHVSSHAMGGTFTRPAAIEFADRTLTIEELYGLQFNKDLVVLSACETGVGKAIRGEGIQSIARAFQYTGATNVLFSLWKVNDFTTARLMEGFYKQLSNKGSYNNALYQSKIDFLTNPDIENSKKSPYNWAAFVYYGNTRLVEESSVVNWWWSLIIIPFVLLFFLRKRKSSD